MSYSIEYNPELKRKYPKGKAQRHFLTRKLIYLLVFFAASYLLIQSKAYHYLLPGNPDVTISAFSTMVERVGDGTSMTDAVRSFCEEIIWNGIQ